MSQNAPVNPVQIALNRLAHAAIKHSRDRHEAEKAYQAGNPEQHARLNARAMRALDRVVRAQEDVWEAAAGARSTDDAPRKKRRAAAPVEVTG